MGFMSRLLEKYQHWASDQIREWQVHTVRASTKKIKDVAFTNIADDDVDNGGDDDGDNDCDDYGDDGGDDYGDKHLCISPNHPQLPGLPQYFTHLSQSRTYIM